MILKYFLCVDLDDQLINRVDIDCRFDVTKSMFIIIIQVFDLKNDEN